jgi:hypothetical protein
MSRQLAKAHASQGWFAGQPTEVFDDGFGVGESLGGSVSSATALRRQRQPHGVCPVAIAAKFGNGAAQVRASFGIEL